jgi:hypothetical protein
MGSQPGRCDGNAHCVQCTADKDCPGTVDDCQHPACVSALCTTAFTAAGTKTSGNPQQIPGDCHKIVCLGMIVGGQDHQTVVDDTDPPSSGTVCITDSCVNGNVVQTFKPGVTCGMSLGQPELCDAQGQCGCHTNMDCTLPSTCGGGGVPLVCGCAPKTCATLGKTCGGPFSDGCYKMLGCDDLIKDGTETDVDCGGNPTTCATRCANGKKCLAGSDCQSGFCDDGVCCSTDCSGLTCQACSAAAKGQGADGVCGPVALGKDPHNNCMSQGAASCGESGGCNGSGACSTYPSGTVCQAPSCNGTVLTKPETCANMTCTAPAPATQDCAPYLCTGGACTTTCANDGQCAATAYCSAGHCQPRLTAGNGTCSANDQCTTNACGTNGVCCAAVCAHMGGTCGNTGCAMGTGACTYPPATTSCGSACGNGDMLTPSSCDGMGTCIAGTAAPCPGNLTCASATACNAACGALGSGDANCVSGYYCDGMGAGACVPKLATGSGPCGAGDQCATGACGLNGVCCAAACAQVGGACGNTGCAAGTGACTYPAAGTSCGGSCSSPNTFTPSACDGMGTCAAGTPAACPNDLTCMSPTACNTGCGPAGPAGDANCIAGYYCDGMSAGTCTAKLGPGGTCTGNDQCTSNACGVSGTGNCCPAGGCVVSGGCGATACSTTGMCVYPGSSTSCGSGPSCNAGTGVLTTYACDGMGGCASTQAPCPGGYTCQDTTTCATSCGTTPGTAGCQPTYYCDGVGAGTCQPQQPPGSPCTGAYVCQTGVCTGGTCM